MNLKRDWDYIEGVAKDRLFNNKTVRHVEYYGPEIEVIGAAGELAARRFLGLPENLHTHFDGGKDILFRGTKIDVKATRFTPRFIHRHLQWPYSKPVKSKVILLVGVDIDRKAATVIGYTTKDEILRAPINRERRYPCYEIPVTELKPAWKLLV